MFCISSAPGKWSSHHLTQLIPFFSGHFYETYSILPRVKWMSTKYIDMGGWQTWRLWSNICSCEIGIFCTFCPIANSCPEDSEIDGKEKRRVFECVKVSKLQQITAQRGGRFCVPSLKAVLKCSVIIQPGRISVILLTGYFVMFIRFVKKAFYHVYEIEYKFIEL